MALALLPFGFEMPKPSVAARRSAPDLIATYFYYAALKVGEASEELAVTGALLR